MGEYSVIGKPVINLDAFEKTKGVALYIDDMKLTGMLHAKMLTSRYPHAKILNIDVSKAKRLPGVKAVVTGRDVPNCLLGIIVRDKPAFAVDKVRYLGEPVAAVAAVDTDTAEEALDLIEVDYEELPAVFDEVEAMQEGAPLVHERLEEYQHIASVRPVPNSNILAHFRLRKGNVEEGFSQADYVFEDEYKSQGIQHAYIEPIACIASIDAFDNITIWSSTQSSDVIRNSLSRGLGIPVGKIRVITPYVGGGFGGKYYTKAEPACVILSRLTGRPVKLVFTREECFTTASIRHPATARIKTGVKKDGTIIARKCTFIWDTGAYAEAGPAIGRSAGIAGGGPYDIPNVWVDSYTVYTNNVIASAYRGFGTPQSAWAIESQMDMIAEKLNIDPLEFRLKNAIEEGATIASGQVAHAVGLKECLRSIGEKGDWRQKRSGKKKYSGVGLACFYRTTATPTDSAAFIKLNNDASADVLVSSVEMGQGARTIFRQIVSEELGIPLEKVNVSIVDTYVTPYDESTTASKTTFYMGNAVKRAAEDARKEIFEIVSPILGFEVEKLELRDGKVLVKGSPDKGIPLDKVPMGGRYPPGIGHPVIGKGYFTTSRPGVGWDLETGQGSYVSAFWMYGAQFVEIEIDPDTGKITVKKVIAAHNVGKAINPLLLEGQYDGGVVMGIGSTLYEQYIRENGRILNASFTDYKLPTALDIPERIEPVVIEVPHKEGPYGAIGIGEPVTVGIPAAIGNAVYDAIGVRIKDLPITSEKILDALRKKA